MAYYYSLRGWLQVEPDKFTEITERIKSLQRSYSEDKKLELYMKGWCWNEVPINWLRYVFYGADVTVEGLDLLEDVLENVTSMGFQLSGYFHAQGEDGDKSFAYKVVDDVWKVEEVSVLIDVT
jgi:hypothetical protein